jgi:hypothetical protein
MRGLAVAAVAVVSCACATAAPPPAKPSQAERMSMRAAKRIDEGRWAAAEDLVVAALQRGELSDDLVGEASAWSSAGAWLMAQGRAADAVVAHTRALACLTEAKASDAVLQRAQTNLALALVAAGRAADAEPYLRVPDSTAPPSARELRRERRQAERQSRREKRWAKDNRRGTKLLELRLEGWYGDLRAQTARAAALLELGRIDEAAELADEVIAALREVADEPGVPADEALAAALAVRGVAAHQRNDNEAARAAFAEALTLDRGAGNPAAVRQHLGWLASLTSGDEAARYFVRRARLARQLRFLADASADLDAAARQASSDEVQRSICAERHLVAAVERLERLDLDALIVAHQSGRGCAETAPAESEPESAPTTQAAAEEKP